MNTANQTYSISTAIDNTNTKYSCEETTFDFKFLDFNIRLWLANINQEHSISTFLADIDRVKNMYNKEHNRINIVHHFANNMKNINAVQVQEKINAVTIGTMIYTVPF